MYKTCFMDKGEHTHTHSSFPPAISATYTQQCAQTASLVAFNTKISKHFDTFTHLYKNFQCNSAAQY